TPCALGNTIKLAAILAAPARRMVISSSVRVVARVCEINEDQRVNIFQFRCTTISQHTSPNEWRSPRQCRRWGLNRATQFGAEFFGDEACINRIAYDLRPNEDNEFGADDTFCSVSEKVAYFWNLFQQRNATAIELV